MPDSPVLIGAVINIFIANIFPSFRLLHTFGNLTCGYFSQEVLHLQISSGQTSDSSLKCFYLLPDSLIRNNGQTSL